MAIVAIDYGSKRVGVAVSESEVIASPHRVLENRGDRDRLIGDLIEIGAELGAETYLVGVPVRPSGSAPTPEIRAFVDALRQKSCKEVVLWDESYSTTEAASQRRELKKSRRNERDEIDMHAATVILQSYLDERQRRKP